VRKNPFKPHRRGKRHGRKSRPAAARQGEAEPRAEALHYVMAAQMEEMSPGDVILLETSEALKSQIEPAFCAVLACPSCGTRGLITRAQLLGAEAVICSSDQCSCHFRIREQSRVVYLPAS
jgi:hypothetical protein